MLNYNCGWASYHFWEVIWSTISRLSFLLDAMWHAVVQQELLDFKHSYFDILYLWVASSDDISRNKNWWSQEKAIRWCSSKMRLQSLVQCNVLNHLGYESLSDPCFHDNKLSEPSTNLELVLLSYFYQAHDTKFKWQRENTASLSHRSHHVNKC